MKPNGRGQREFLHADGLVEIAEPIFSEATQKALALYRDHRKAGPAGRGGGAMSRFTCITETAAEVLKTCWPKASVDSIVTDPPLRHPFPWAGLGWRRH